MPLIEKKHRQGIPCELIIKFSLKHKRFEIEFSDKSLDLTKINKSLFYLNNYEDLDVRLDVIQEQYLSKLKFEKKQIVISFKTSQSPVVDKMFDNGERIFGGSGFTIQWWVVEKYMPEKLKGHARPLELYKIIESSPNSNTSPKNKINILGQLFMSTPTRTLEYSDELYNFLKSLDIKIAAMCDQLYSFFDINEDKFLENIKSQQLLLS